MKSARKNRHLRGFLDEVALGERDEASHKRIEIEP